MIAGVRERAGAPITRRELGLWGLASFSLAHVLDAARAQGAGTLSLGVGAIVLIAWGCALAIAWRDEDRTPASGSGIGMVAAAALAALVLHGTALMLVFTLGGVALLWRGGAVGAARPVGAILLAIAAQGLWARVVGLMLAGPILRLDTALAGVLLDLAVPGSRWSGNRLAPPDGVGIVVEMGCSSFANLSLVCLCFTALAMLDRVRDVRRGVIAMLCACALLIVLNTVRLLLMARSLDLYVYWHTGAGAELFVVVGSALTVIACSIGARWAAPRA